MRAFFHLRRFDGAIERDLFGRDVPADRIAAAAKLGARGLICEAITEGLPLAYRQYEIENESGISLLDFSFESVIQYVAERKVVGAKALPGPKRLPGS